MRNVYTHFVCNLVYCAQRTEWRFCLHPLAGRVITQTSVKHSAPLSEKYCVFLQLRVLFESALQVILLPVIAKLILISSQSLIKGLHSRSKLERWQMKVATLPKTGVLQFQNPPRISSSCFICRITLLNLLINTNLLQTLRSNAVNSLTKLADSFSTLCDSQLHHLDKRHAGNWLLVPKRYISMFPKWAWSLPNQVMRTPVVVHLF